MLNNATETDEQADSSGIVGDPQEVGLDPDALRRLHAALLGDLEAGKNDGACVIVARGGQIAYSQAIGLSDVTAKRAAKLSDRFVVMSVTKSFTAALVLKLIDRGMLTIDTRVADIIPEYAQRGKQRITVRHLLTHTAGVSTGFEGPGGTMASSLEPGDLDFATAALAPWPILHRPGKRVVYTPWEGYSILGEVVRRLDPGKRRYRDILREEIFEPLGMNDTSLGLRVDHPDRVPVVLMGGTGGAAQAPLLFQNMNKADENWEVPAGSGFSTAPDVFRFADAIRNGGRNDNGSILSRAIIKYAYQNHTGDLQNEFWDFNKEAADLEDFPANFTLGGGYVRGDGHHLTPLGLTASPSAFGAVGSGSAGWMVDPERDLTVVFLAAGLLQGLTHFDRLSRVNDLALAAVL